VIRLRSRSLPWFSSPEPRELVRLSLVLFCPNPSIQAFAMSLPPILMADLLENAVFIFPLRPPTYEVLPLPFLRFRHTSGFHRLTLFRLPSPSVSYFVRTDVFFPGGGNKFVQFVSSLLFLSPFHFSVSRLRSLLFVVILFRKSSTFPDDLSLLSE